MGILTKFFIKFSQKYLVIHYKNKLNLDNGERTLKTPTISSLPDSKREMMRETSLKTLIISH